MRCTPTAKTKWCGAGPRLAYGGVLVGIARRETVERYHATVHGSRDRGFQLHVFGGGGSRRHPAERPDPGGRLRGAEPLGIGRGGSLRREPVAPGFLGGVRPGSAARRGAGAFRAAAAARDGAPDAGGSAAQACREPGGERFSRNALPYATALAGACPRLAPAANVLPPEHRRFSSRAVYVPTVVLAALLLLVAGAACRLFQVFRPPLPGQAARRDRAHRAGGAAGRGARPADRCRSRRGPSCSTGCTPQTRADLDALNELTRLIEPPAWTNSVDLTRDAVRITGEAPQAAPLLKILDSSPFFENSAPDMIQRSTSGGSGEMFQIHTTREKSK